MVEQGEDDGKKAYDINSFDLTEDEGKVLVQQIAGYKEAIKDCEYQLSTTHARVEAVLDESGVKETKIRKTRHSEVTLTDNKRCAGLSVRWCPWSCDRPRQSEIKTCACGNTMDSSWTRRMSRSKKFLGRTNVADVPTKIVPSCLTSTELALWQAFAVLPKFFEKGEL